MTTRIEPTPFGMAISRAAREMLDLARSALRQTEEARAAIGPAVLIDPDLALRSRRLQATHSCLSCIVSYLTDTLDVLRPLVEQECAVEQPAPAEQPRTVTALGQQDGES